MRSPGKAAAQHFLQAQLQHLALQLLGALFGAPAQLLDLPGHGRDLGLAFQYLELERLLGFGPGLVAHGGERRSHPFLDGELQFAPGLVELAGATQGVGLGRLGFGELGVPLAQRLGKGRRAVGLRLERSRRFGPGLRGRSGRDRGAQGLQPGRDLGVDAGPRLGQRGPFARQGLPLGGDQRRGE